MLIGLFALELSILNFIMNDSRLDCESLLPDGYFCVKYSFIAKCLLQ